MPNDALKQRGFTLIELMITLVIAMVILGGLLLNFTSQSGMYKYQSKRGDAVLDLEFTMRFVADDIKRALIPVGNLSQVAPSANVLTAMDGSGINSTTSLKFTVWDEDAGVSPTWKVLREYAYVSPELKYDRTSGTTTALQAILGDGTLANRGIKVTHFRVFQDGFTPRPRFVTGDAAGSGYIGLPPALTPKDVMDGVDTSYKMPGFTILIEIEIDSAPRSSAGTDVLGNPLTNARKRIWRYKQVYPSSITN